MASKFEKIILVTGATGKQGGAVAKHLRMQNWPVRAISRDPSKPSSRALVDMGIEVVRADYNDPDSITKAMDGVYGVYSVQTFEEGLDAEIRQGKLLADLAKQENIKHFVYSSVGGADRNTGIPHFETKWQIEQHIRSLNLSCTIFRPVFFMDNFLAPQMRSAIVQGTLSTPMKPDKPLQMIAVDDIGAFVAMAFDKPGDFMCQEIELAGDEMTMPRAAELLGRVLGREVKFVEMPIEQMRQMSEEYAIMYEWFNKFGYAADIYKLRSMYPELKTFDSWLHHANWQQFAPTQTFAGKR